MRRFLIDTDTASDDAVAIVMALQHPDVHVEALTVVAGNVGLDQAVQNALYTVELCGKETPVYAGRARPIMRTLETAQSIHGHDGMGDCGLPLHGRTPTAGRGVDVIVDTILGSPGEVTLVCLGPLSNVSAAVLRAPEITEAVERVVIMGGTGVHGPGNVNTTKPISSYKDLVGMKMRVGGGVANDVGTALGVAGVNMPAPAVYEAISSGVTDGVFFPMETMYASRSPSWRSTLTATRRACTRPLSD